MVNGKPSWAASDDGRLSRSDELIRRTVGFVAPHGANIFVAVTLAFALLILLGFVLLMLPQASAIGEWTNPRTALFTATSAVTDTGLVTVETGSYWSNFGQMVILILIQLGGLGFMAVTSFLLLMAARRILFRDFRVADALGTHNVREFAWVIYWTLGITFVMEVVGIILLAFLLREEGTSGHPWWAATFHAISSFNNAGFDTVGNGSSLANYASNAQVLSVVALLSFVGALSAPVIIALVRLMRGRQLGLDAKLALATVLALVVIGTLLIFLMERHNPGTLGPLSTPGKLVNSFFTSVTARTAGFTSLNMGALGLRALFIIMILMFIGGVSGSTAGGIKVTTFSVLWLTAVSYIRGRRHVDFSRQRISETQIHKAVAVVFFALALVLVIALALSVTDEGIPFRDLSFETVSAFGTVGFSTGITSSLSAAGQFLLVFTMFVGRLGPLTVALAFAESRAVKEEECPEAEVRVG
jgi:trk system potassium uptake protein TrkH